MWYNFGKYLKGCDFINISTLGITIIVSLLSGFAGTIYLEQTRKKSQNLKLSNCLILLYLEINDHTYWLKKLYSAKEAFISCSKLLRDSPTTEWNRSKYFLAENLTSEDLKSIIYHYRNLGGLAKVFYEEPNYLLEETTINLFVKDAANALKILMKDHTVKAFVESTIEKESKEQNSTPT